MGGIAAKGLEPDAIQGFLRVTGLHREALNRQEPLRIVGCSSDHNTAHIRFTYAHNDSNASCLVATDGQIGTEHVAYAARLYVGQEAQAFAVRAYDTQTNQYAAMVQVRVPNTALAGLHQLKLAGELSVLEQTLAVHTTALLQPARHAVVRPGRQALDLHAAIQHSIGNTKGATGHCCPVAEKTPTDAFCRPTENGVVQGVALSFDRTARW